MPLTISREIGRISIKPSMEITLIGKGKYRFKIIINKLKIFSLQTASRSIPICPNKLIKVRKISNPKFRKAISQQRLFQIRIVGSTIRKSKNSPDHWTALLMKPWTTQSSTAKPISRSCKIPQFKSRYLPMKMAQNELYQPLTLVDKDRCNSMYVNTTHLNRLLALALRN